MLFTHKVISSSYLYDISVELLLYVSFREDESPWELSNMSSL